MQLLVIRKQLLAARHGLLGCTCIPSPLSIWNKTLATSDYYYY